MKVISNKIKTKYGTIYKRSDSTKWQIYTNINGRAYRKSTGIAIDQDEEGLLALDILNNFAKLNYNVSKKHKSVITLAKDFIKTLAEMNNQTYNVITLETAILSYLRSLHNANNTKEIYQRVLKDFQRYIKKDVELDMIEPKDITNYRDYLIQKNYNSNTINHKINYLNIFFNYAIKENYITENPCKHITKLETRSEHNQIRPFTEQELKSLLCYVKGTYIESLCLISLYTGARLATALNLTWEDINFSTNTVTIYEKKNHKSITHTLHPQLRSHLLKLNSINNKGRIFTQKSSSTVSVVFNKILIKAGMLSPKAKLSGQRRNRNELCFHSLRHNFSTRLAENPNISAETRLALLGHSTLDNVYTS